MYQASKLLYSHLALYLSDAGWNGYECGMGTWFWGRVLEARGGGGQECGGWGVRCEVLSVGLVVNGLYIGHWIVINRW